MTSGDEQPPLTRREARERERLLAQQRDGDRSNRRAATNEPVAAGEVPVITSPVQLPDPAIARQSVPAMPVPSGASAPAAARSTGSGFSRFRQAAVAPEALTTPLAVQKTVPQEPGSLPSAGEQGELPEHTLTRRELRAMLQAEQANRQAAQPAEAAEQGADDAGQERDGSTAVVERPRPAAPATAQAAAPEPETVTPHAAEPALSVELPAAPASTQSGWPFASDYAANPAVDVQDASLSGTATAPSALIMPMLPTPGSATGPLASTGEILVTGTIDLPHSLSATGTHSALHDSADIDRLFDQPEEPANTSEMKPVRASKAVSSHSPAADMLPQQKSRGGRMPAILAGTAAILAAGVAGLIVTGYVLGLL